MTLEIEDHCPPEEDPVDFCAEEYLFDCDDLWEMT